MMDIIKASLAAAVMRSGGTVSGTICDQIEAMPTIASGTIAGQYTYVLRYGALSEDAPQPQYDYVIDDIALYMPMGYVTMYGRMFLCIYHNGSLCEAVQHTSASVKMWQYFERYDTVGGGGEVIDIKRWELDFVQSTTPPTVTLNKRLVQSNPDTYIVGASVNVPYVAVYKYYERDYDPDQGVWEDTWTRQSNTSETGTVSEELPRSYTSVYYQNYTRLGRDAFIAYRRDILETIYINANT
jgi:hypothetical protein